MKEYAVAIIVYGHESCPMVVPVRLMLNRAKVTYTYINIHEDPHAAERVRAINHGNESVPTLVFEDGTTLTEPSPAQLSARLKDLGFAVNENTRIIAWLSMYAPLLGGGLLGVLVGGILGDAGSGLIFGTAVGFGFNLLNVRFWGK